MKKTVAVALSGGLDSAIAASLLKRQGYLVIGIHFQTGYEASGDGPHPHSPKLSPSARVKRIAEKIGIPLETVNCFQTFEKEVVRYFVDSYRTAQTPNPCMVCNKRIKFGLILERAKALGASLLATGHYARIGREGGGNLCLLKGVDRTKDQSYFLARLTQNQLSQALFPLGTYTKNQVRGMAKAQGLLFLEERESQELCFIRHQSYREFLSHMGGFESKPGAIVTAGGEVVGTHRGLHAYTVGQRRGIGIPGPEPYYVVRLDNEQNRLVVGPESELTEKGCLVARINWIGVAAPDGPLAVQTRIRYRHRAAGSVVTPLGKERARVAFSHPQCAVTPGQGAVFYQGERVLGGGWIVRILSDDSERP
jgi:tRNA-specific 2-thiouridylase